MARTIALSVRHKRASGMPSRYAKARHLPCTLSWRGAYLPTHVREGCPAGRGLVSWANNTHLSPKVRRFTPHSWSNGRQPPTATCGNARDQPPSQRHAAWKLHSIVRNREGDDELSRPEGPVASLPARIAFGSNLPPSLVLFYVNFSTFNFRQNLKRFRFRTFKMIIAHWSYSGNPIEIVNYLIGKRNAF